ncbi:MAG: hypothetical protein ACHQ06_01490 [Candidatus Dormibacteria bacterium]|jgi:hypothetical protein
MPLRRATAALAGAAVLAAAVAFGWVDGTRCLDLLTGRVVTRTTAFAVVAAVCWLGAATVVGAVTATVLDGGGPVRHRIRRAPLALLAGLTVLGLGVVHHNAGYAVCCANASTAQQVERHVR